MDPETSARPGRPTGTSDDGPIPIELRPYFVFGDILATVASGALVGLAIAALVGSGWNMVVGMLVGMLLGMVLALLAGFVAFFILFGLMEVMVPIMLTGMVAGMWVGMAAATDAEMGAGRGALLGVEIGLGVLVFTYVANALIRSRGRKWTS